MKLEITLPVYNEESRLERGAITLYRFLKENDLGLPWSILIADNGSTDSTLSLARALSHRFPEIKVIHLDQKGRGRALKRAWLQSEADIVGYMDIDLSTDISALFAVVKAFDSDNDIVIGSRYLPDSRVRRSLKRTILSRGYNFLIQLLFQAGFRDAQCGFKFLRREVALRLVPQVRHDGWFFDTELLLRAEAAGYNIKEIPVTWQEDIESRVSVIKTVWDDIKWLLRLRLELWLRKGKGDG